MFSSRYAVYETLSWLSPPFLFPSQVRPSRAASTSATALRLPLSTLILNFIDFIALLPLFCCQSSSCLTMPCNTEVRVTPYGIPYVVEFANVSIWPRPPLVHADGGRGHQPSDLAPKPPRPRSKTLPTTTTPKPLPSSPLPVRSISLKLFSKKTSVAPAELESALEELDFARPVIRRDASFAAEARNSAHRHFKIFNDGFSASEETLVEFEGTVPLTSPVPVAPSEDGLSLRTGGLYIQFPTPPTTSDVPTGAPSPHTIEPETEGTQVDFEKTRRLRLYRLSRAISKAVLAAGMEAPSKPAKKFDTEESASSKTGDARTVKVHQGLFKGTYSQVRDAFRAAGLVTTPCGEDGIPNGMRAPSYSICSLPLITHLIGIFDFFSHSSWRAIYRESRWSRSHCIHQGCHVGLIDDQERM